MGRFDTTWSSLVRSCALGVRGAIPLCLEIALGLVLLAGFLSSPLALAHAAAVLIVLEAFLVERRRAVIWLAVSLVATGAASVLARVPTEDLAIQLPFVYGVAGLVVFLAGELRRSRDAAHEARGRLEHLALYDGLTDLPNRTLLHDRTGQAIAAARRQRTGVGLLFLDLNGFKDVNDTFGHHAGDVLLTQIASRLRATVRAADTVARLGGDEFAVLLPGADEPCAREIATRLLRALEAPFAVDEEETARPGESLPPDRPSFEQGVTVGASIGIALYPDAADTDELLRRADAAMYAAKGTLAGLAVYDRRSDADDVRRFALLGELRDALDRDEFVLHFQPVVDTRSRGVSGFEALVRWRHPTRGLLPPSEFIPLAEQAGQMARVSERILDAALRQERAWCDVGLAVPVAVNLSMRNLLDPALADLVAVALARWGVPPERLTLEITEGSLMVDPARAARTVARLRELGVRVAIDDFGTGYSSLGYLNQLQADELKIDRSFVCQDADPSCSAIVRATVDLAHTLGLAVVAEGVEDGATFERLAALGCDRVQGYYVSPPLPAEDVSRWLAESPWASRSTSVAA